MAAVVVSLSLRVAAALQVQITSAPPSHSNQNPACPVNHSCCIQTHPRECKLEVVHRRTCMSPRTNRGRIEVQTPDNNTKNLRSPVGRFCRRDGIASAMIDTHGMAHTSVAAFNQRPTTWKVWAGDMSNMIDCPDCLGSVGYRDSLRIMVCRRRVRGLVHDTVDSLSASDTPAWGNQDQFLLGEALISRQGTKILLVIDALPPWLATISTGPGWLSSQ